MPWRHRNIPKVILNRFGIIHFFIIFSRIFSNFSLKMSNLWELELGRVPFVWPDSYKYHCSNLKEAITKLGLFFKWIAPQNFNKQAHKIINKIRKMSLGAWRQNLRLAPGWRRISLLEHRICSTSHLRLAPGWRRITLHSTEICSTSH